MAINFNSPWNKSEFVDLETGTLRKDGVLSGLRLPDGKILANMHDNTSEELLNAFAKLFNAEKVLIKGSWVFEPERESEDEDVQ